MGQSQIPHFDHHLREMHRTRLRFRLGLLAMFLGLAGLWGLRSHVGPSVATVSGRVYNASTGIGLANIKVHFCDASGYAISNSAGYWSMNEVSKRTTCVRYSSGAPVTVTGPVAVGSLSGRVASTYEHQVVGLNCLKDNYAKVCSDENKRWDRAVDTGYDFAFTTKPEADNSLVAVRPAPLRPAEPIARGMVASAATSDTQAPSAPDSFQSTVASDNAIVELQWSVASDTNGVKAYTLERSVDQQTWQLLSDNIQGTAYTDKSADFGVHYFYRLKAVDPSGNASGYATTDVSTSNFNSTSSASDAATYTSGDNVVVVTVPQGAVPSTADCSVTTVNLPTGSKPLGSSTQKLVEGPFTLICKTLAGDQVQSFMKPVLWTYNIKDKLKNMGDPQPYTSDDNGHTAIIKGGKFDPAAGVLKFETTDTSSTLVLGMVAQGVSLNFVAVFVLLIGAIVVVAILVLRKKQRHKYDDYLRSKYYNL